LQICRVFVSSNPQFVISKLPVEIGVHFFRSGEIERNLAEMGFAVEETIEREPYPEIEHQSRRAYIFARREAANTVAHVPETHST